MFTLTSTATKLAVLAFSAAMAITSFQSVALSFNAPDHAVIVVELPTVVIVGHRASLQNSTAQTAAKAMAKPAV